MLSPVQREGGDLADTRASFWRRHRWFAWTAGSLLAVMVVTTAVLAVLARRVEPYLRAQIVQGLQDRFHTRVELDSFHVAQGYGKHGQWGIWAIGRGLRIWPPQRTGGDRPLEIAVQSVPLIALEEFSFHVPIRREMTKSMRISEIRFKELDIHVPPRSERDRQTGLESATTGPQGTSPNLAAPGQAQPISAGPLTGIVVERIDCDRAQLLLETDKPDKLPLGFEITHLRLTHVTAGAPMEFEADVSNPKPVGMIHTTGSFGPWQAADPGESPVSGTYKFEHADLATFKGIAGILSSTGRYQGTLRNIVVDGEADVPDFRLTHFGNAMPLHTQFHARVDGTDGDTWLEPVDATLGRSHFTTQGRVVRVKTAQDAAGARRVSEAEQAEPLKGGHMIDLQVNVDRGHLEDFLHLASRSPTPLLTGEVTAKAALRIPPGKEPVHERMKLDGFFKLDQAHFTSAKIQERIEDLSLRGQGRPGALKAAEANNITSQMQGSFHMAKAVITLPDLEYSVPGADIRLKGTYSLEGFLNFDGTARMNATVSQMVGGWKGFLLKPADRFFKKDGAGTVVPIQIKGTRDAPEFGVNFGRMKRTSPETPGQKQQQ